MSHPVSIAICKVLHLVALALWGGGALFFSYWVAPRIFSSLGDQLPARPPPGVAGITEEVGRRLAGDVVGAVFPTYFAGQIIAGMLATATGLMLAWHGMRLERARAGLVLAALVIVTLHAATVYPRSVRMLDERYQAQAAGDEPRAAELRHKFAMLHGVSQLLNLITITLVLSALVLAGLALRDPPAALVAWPSRAGKSAPRPGSGEPGYEPTAHINKMHYKVNIMNMPGRWGIRRSRQLSTARARSSTISIILGCWPIGSASRNSTPRWAAASRC